MITFAKQIVCLSMPLFYHFFFATLATVCASLLMRGSIKFFKGFVYHCSSHSKQSTVKIKPLCVRIVEDAERQNKANGHENLGFLSFRAGFLPTRPPLLSFPASHRKWDELIDSLPDLVRDQTLQSFIQRMPTLPADKNSLPDIYLHRAASFLCVSAHAYIRLDGEAPLELVGDSGLKANYNIPECLEKPWTEVSHRLGRKSPFMSYIDMVAYNWQRKIETGEDTNCDKLIVEDHKILIPTVDNREENVFYLTQTELLAQAAPLLNSIAIAQQAVLENDTNGLKVALTDMISILKRISRTTLAKVSAKPTSPTYTDPVVWTKSIASLAVPLRQDVQGPTGTGSPIFHMLDEFIERKEYLGHIGDEGLKLRAAFPPHWRAFIKAIGTISVQSYVENCSDSDCQKLWKAMIENYRGQFGVLGLHRRKAFAYLSVSFRIGRSRTIGGFRGKPLDEPWVKVHNELEQARKERLPRGEDSVAVDSVTADACHEIELSELLCHRDRDSGLWLAANGNVYDATAYIDQHPGGVRIMLGSGGRDVSADLRMVQHFSDTTIAARLAQFYIGRLHDRQFKSSLLQQLYGAMKTLAFKVVDFQNTWAVDTTYLGQKMTRNDPPNNQMTAQKLRYFHRSWTSLTTVYAPSLAFYVEAALKTCSNGSVVSTPPDWARRLKDIDGLHINVFSESSDVTMLQAVRLVEVAAERLDNCRQSAVRAIRVLEESYNGDVEQVISQVQKELAVSVGILAGLGERPANDEMRK